jgi:hypothetical protein
VDVTASLPAAEAAPRSEKIARLLGEIDALIADDEAADRQITGGWRTFDGHLRCSECPHVGRVQRRPLPGRRELPAAVATGSRRP